MLELSNLRRKATVNDLPSAGRQVTATFWVDRHPKHGERISRTTAVKPKHTDYYKRMLIVDGDDGRTQLLGQHIDVIVLIPGTLKGAQYFYSGSEEYQKYSQLFQDILLTDEQHLLE